MKCIAIIALLMAVSTAVLADGHCSGFLSGDTCYFAITDSPMDLVSATNACQNDGAELAVIKTEAVYDLAKAYVKSSYSYGRDAYAVFWMDLSFDYENDEIIVPDGTLPKSAFENMWYHGQPFSCRNSKDLVLVFRPDEKLIKDPNMEKYQGFYSISATSKWNAMCMKAVETSDE